MNKCIPTLVIIGSAILSARQIWAADCKAEKGLETYLQKTFGSARSQPSRVLAFNHRTQTWAAYSLAWVCPASEPLCRLPVLNPVGRPDYELQNNNVPRLALATSDDVAIVVVDTNPMLYSATRKPATEKEIEGLAQVQALAAAIGGFWQAFVQAQTSQEGSHAATVKEKYKEVVTIKGLRVSDPLGEKELTDAATVLANAQSNYAAALEDLGKAASPLARLHADEALLLALVNSTEADRPPDNAMLPDTSRPTTRLAEINEALTRMAATRAALQKTPKPCVAPCPKLLDALRLVLATPGQRAAAALGTVLKDLKEKVKDSACFADIAVQTALETVAAKLDRCSSVACGLTPGGKSNLTTLLTFATAVPVLVDQSDRAVTSADALLDKRTDQIALAAAVDTAIDRYKDAYIRGDGDYCSLRHGVIGVQEPPVKLRWNKIYTGKFDIKATGLNAEKVAKRHAELTDVSYDLVAKSTLDFSLGFGLIYTEAVNPVWSAVENPSNTAQKIIARTDEESRAGTPALLFTTFPHAWRNSTIKPGLDIGTCLDTAKPALYLGLSIRVAPFARLAAGRGWFLVDRLAKNQHEIAFLGDGSVDPASVTPVTSKDDIRRRRGITDKFYVSLVITLDSLEFFKAKDK